MKILRDHEGLAIRLTDERLAHILEHPEMAAMEAAIAETLRHPDPNGSCNRSAIRWLGSFAAITFAPVVGGKYLCVVVKVLEADAFVLTAYLTDPIKRGTTLWPMNANA